MAAGDARARLESVRAAVDEATVRRRGDVSALVLLVATAHDPEAIWIANTDADSRVPTNWLPAQLEGAATGADVIVGTVRPDFAELEPEQVSAWTATHEPGSPNGHVHGANLGIRASAYRAVGGFAAAMEHEDVDLVQRARAAGFAAIASDVGEVTTSGRRQGRTPGGYAAHLHRSFGSSTRFPVPVQ